eukprot:4014879-Lingulodinium_polyedra.AAC.1
MPNSASLFSMLSMRASASLLFILRAFSSASANPKSHRSTANWRADPIRSSLLDRAINVAAPQENCGMPHAGDKVFLFADRSIARMRVAPANHECFNS